MNGAESRANDVPVFERCRACVDRVEALLDLVEPRLFDLLDRAFFRLETLEYRRAPKLFPNVDRCEGSRSRCVGRRGPGPHRISLRSRLPWSSAFSQLTPPISSAQCRIFTPLRIARTTRRSWRPCLSARSDDVRRTSTRASSSASCTRARDTSPRGRPRVVSSRRAFPDTATRTSGTTKDRVAPSRPSLSICDQTRIAKASAS